MPSPGISGRRARVLSVTGIRRSRRAPFAALAGIGLLLGVCLSLVAAADGNRIGIGGTCLSDGDCERYYHCRKGVCRIPPAVLGWHNARTPTVEFGAGARSRGRFFVELARTESERTRGLGRRPSLAAGWGMLFIFPRPVRYAFTMARMRFALDLIFIDGRERVVDIIENAQPGVAALLPSGAYRYVLELNAGTVRTRGIRVGDLMRTIGITRP